MGICDGQCGGDDGDILASLVQALDALFTGHQEWIDVLKALKLRLVNTADHFPGETGDERNEKKLNENQINFTKLAKIT